MVNWDTPDHSQYVIARNAMRPLETAGIPYSLAIGNHDTQATGVGGSARDPAHTRELVRDTTVFNQYFTAGQYGAVSGPVRGRARSTTRTPPSRPAACSGWC